MEKQNLLVGIDVGGTNTVFGFVDSENNYLHESVFPTNAEKDVDDFISRLDENIKSAFTKFENDYSIAGIGLAAPSANYLNGKIESPANLSWGDVDIISKMKNYFNCPVAIINDANAVALGEQEFGCAKGMNNFVVLTLGTGLGSGIIINGQLVYGENGHAGELGHTTIDPEGRKCSCGKYGCLETYISAGGLRRTVFHLLSISTEKSPLKDIPYNQLTSKKISELAREKDPVALKAFDYTGEILGRTLANTVSLIDPEAFILFGGLIESDDLLINPTRRYLDKYLLSIYKGNVKILKSELQNGKAAILGACSLIKKEIMLKQAI